MKQINWGFIGCGEVTEKKSGPAFNEVSGSRVVAVMGRSPEKTRSYAQRHGIPKWFTDAQALIDDPEVNAVYIATPPSSHATYAIMAMHAGKPCYVEKPLAASYDDCARVNHVSQMTGVPCYVAYYRRYLPYFREVKNVVESGKIGKIYEVKDANGRKYAMKKILTSSQTEIASLTKEYEMLLSLSSYKLNLVNIHGMETKQLDKTTYVMYVLMDIAVRDWEKEIEIRKKKKNHYSEHELEEIIRQLIHTFAELQRHGISHRDIKPQNLLIDLNTQTLKLCDFGSAKKLVQGEPNVSYICSRYYRAPELIFGSTEYDLSIDIWSTGCVLAELLIGKPLFPGDSNVDQLVEIIKVLGTPTAEQIKSMNPSYQNFRFPTIITKDWKDVFFSSFVE